MKNKWLIMFLTGAITITTTSIHADCSNMPIGTELAKSIMAEDIDKAKKYLTEYNEAVEKYLDGCKDEGKDQQVNIMLLTYQDKVKDLEEDLNKGSEVAFDCSKVPNDTALKNAFASGNAQSVKSTYSEYSKKAADYLEHCAAHEEYELVYEASLLHEEEYEKWKKK